VVRRLMRDARAFVFAAEEDFGIVTVEAQASGTPVILYGKGGGLEIVRGLSSLHPTGVFFPEQTADTICHAVELFETVAGRISPLQCRANAQRFNVDRFRNEFSAVVDDAMSQQSGGYENLDFERQPLRMA
jgi:glycosyltransferase involved in cell wall biosynthesis